MLNLRTQKFQPGFTLPTVVVASVVMLLVLVAAGVYISSSVSSMNDQYYDRLARDAADSGIAFATQCIKDNADPLDWVGGTALRPADNCSGSASNCANTNCHLVRDGNTRTYYEVTAWEKDGMVRIKSTGIAERVRTSQNDQVWKRYTSDRQMVEDSFTDKVSSGESHTCAAVGGKAYCWGEGSEGRLGTGSIASSSTPRLVSATGVLKGKRVTDIAAGGRHTCAIADGKAYCWGYGTSGQLGNNSATSSTRPVAVDISGVLRGKTVTAISAGNGHSCAIADSRAYCWGGGGNGRLGNSSTANRQVPVAVNTASALGSRIVTSISAGYNHSCATADGRAYCWGYNPSNRLGNTSAAESQTTPVAVNTSGAISGKDVVQVAAGYHHSCVVADERAYCWGNNGGNGRMGNGGTAAQGTPVAVSVSGALGGKSVMSISASSTHTCAVADGEPYCWGSGADGKIGDNATADRLTPVAVTTSGALQGKTVTGTSVGPSHTCVLADGEPYCWGSGADGRLGNGASSQKNMAVKANLTVTPSVLRY